MTEENKTLTDFYPVYYIKDKDGIREYNYTKIEMETPNTSSNEIKDKKARALEKKDKQDKIQETLETKLRETHPEVNPHIIDTHYNEHEAKSQKTKREAMYITLQKYDNPT
jgi:hypothetical protein